MPSTLAACYFVLMSAAQQLLIFAPAFIIVLLIFIGVAIHQTTMDNPTSLTRKDQLKQLYYYLVSFVSLMIFVFSLNGFIGAATRVAIAPDASRFGYPGDYFSPECQPPLLTSSTVASCEQKRREFKVEQARLQRTQNYSDLASDLALLIISIPLFVFHFRAARRQEKSL